MHDRVSAHGYREGRSHDNLKKIVAPRLDDVKTKTGHDGSWIIALRENATKSKSRSFSGSVNMSRDYRASVTCSGAFV